MLYRAVITIPSQVPVGTYTAETFLIDDGRVLAAATRDIQIGKSGFERYVALAARRHDVFTALLRGRFRLVSAGPPRPPSAAVSKRAVCRTPKLILTAPAYCNCPVI